MAPSCLLSFLRHSCSSFSSSVSARSSFLEVQEVLHARWVLMVALLLLVYLSSALALERLVRLLKVQMLLRPSCSSFYAPYFLYLKFL